MEGLCLVSGKTWDDMWIWYKHLLDVGAARLQAKAGDCQEFFQVGVGWAPWVRLGRSLTFLKARTWKTLSSSAKGLRSVQWAVKRNFFIENFRLNLSIKLKIDATNQRWEENREKEKEGINVPQRKCGDGVPSKLSKWSWGKVIWLTVFSLENHYALIFVLSPSCLWGIETLQCEVTRIMLQEDKDLVCSAFFSPRCQSILLHRVLTNMYFHELVNQCIIF